MKVNYFEMSYENVMIKFIVLNVLLMQFFDHYDLKLRTENLQEEGETEI